MPEPIKIKIYNRDLEYIGIESPSIDEFAELKKDFAIMEENVLELVEFKIISKEQIIRVIDKQDEIIDVTNYIQEFLKEGTEKQRKINITLWILIIIQMVSILYLIWR